jgi:DNA-directed RNA polymerase specialized sigma24 family protein
MVAGRASPGKVEPVDVVVVADTDVEFAAFMSRSTPALARTAWLLCGDTHLAEEPVQQALVKTYLAWPKARQGEPLAYARRVLANLRIDRWRRRRREVLMASDTLPDHDDDSQSPADQHAERDRLSRALMLLPTKQRRSSRKFCATRSTGSRQRSTSTSRTSSPLPDGGGPPGWAA